MGVIVTFSDGSDWYVSNIGFDQLVENHRILFPGEAEMQHELEMVQAVGGIILPERSAELTKKILHALEKVAERTIQELPSYVTRLVPKDVQEQQDHLVVIRKLLPLVKREKTVPER